MRTGPIKLKNSDDVLPVPYKEVQHHNSCKKLLIIAPGIFAVLGGILICTAGFLSLRSKYLNIELISAGTLSLLGAVVCRCLLPPTETPPIENDALL